MDYNASFRSSIRHSLPSGILVLFFVMLVPQALGAVEHEEEYGEHGEIGRSGFFIKSGVGAGMYLFEEYGGTDDTGMNFSIGIESKIGGYINSNLSVFLLMHANIISFDSLRAFTEWVFAERDMRLLATIFIPFALFSDSLVFAGPGLTYYTSTHAPSMFVEGGVGYYSIQSVIRETFIMGAGLFAGVGVEITPSISCGLRIVWAPVFFHSKWTPSPKDYISFMGFIYY